MKIEMEGKSTEYEYEYLYRTPRMFSMTELDRQAPCFASPWVHKSSALFCLVLPCLIIEMRYTCMVRGCDLLGYQLIGIDEARHSPRIGMLLYLSQCKV